MLAPLPRDLEGWQAAGVVLRFITTVRPREEPTHISAKQSIK